MPEPDLDDPIAVRRAGPALLAAALTDARRALLRQFEAWQHALPASLEIPYAPELNPPLWELGHIAWFEERWLARYPERLRGKAAEPDTALAAPDLARADRLFDSSRVEHKSRWRLDLPDATRTLAMMQRTRQRTLALLADSAEDDDALYFFRLALLHEDMHREAWAYMAQHLEIDVSAALDATGPAASAAAGEWSHPGGSFRVGHDGPGFAFDNELGGHDVELAPFSIDRAPVTWAAYLAFVDAGGYADERHWTPEGWAWRERHGAEHPRHLRRVDGGWAQCRFAVWHEVDPGAPALHLTQHEALAWCRWAGRRLPSEAEWECAAVSAEAMNEDFDWGQVWEWTASPFVPYPGFEAHPYRDYSMPWFDGRPVLRGASFATAARMKHPRYRNYFPAERNDLFTGFRSCAR